MTTLVETEWLAQNLSNENLRIIEINWDGLKSYDTEHIPGSVGWNWKEALWDPFERQFPSESEFAARLGSVGIKADTTVIIYGAPIQFGTYAWWVFKLFGHKDVGILNGGKIKWRNEGRDLVADVPTFESCIYDIPRFSGKSRASRRDVLQALGNDQISILDHRSFEEYSGQRVGLPGKPDVGAERYGRIPTAKHLPFDSLLNDDSSFKSKEEIQAQVDALGLAPSSSIISYCRLAHRATLAYFAMTELLDFKDVRVYDGSWTEWGSLVGVPIER